MGVCASKEPLTVEQLPSVAMPNSPPAIPNPVPVLSSYSSSSHTRVSDQTPPKVDAESAENDSLHSPPLSTKNRLPKALSDVIEETPSGLSPSLPTRPVLQPLVAPAALIILVSEHPFSPSLTLDMASTRSNYSDTSSTPRLDSSRSTPSFSAH